jgi:hypothetical protein
MTNPGPHGGDDPLAVGEVPPRAVPPAPAYEPSELLEPVPVHDELAVGTPTYDALTREPALSGDALTREPALSGDAVTREPVLSGAFEPVPEAGSGPLAAVKALAEKNPAAFLGAALAIGWVLGKVFSSSDDES